MSPDAPNADLSQIVRTFLALPVPREVIGRLQTLQRELNAGLDGVSWSRPEAIHLTLRFFGNVPQKRLDELQKAIQGVCASVPPFPLSAMRAGAFSERVVWVGIGGSIERLQQLETRIAQATCGFGDHGEEREFRPHLTIGRVRKNRMGRISVLRNLAGYAETDFGQWPADHLELMRSELLPQGARYTCLARIPLMEKIGGAVSPESVIFRGTKVAGA